MGIRELEAGILRELRVVTGLPKLRQKDIMEWRTSEIEPQGGEVLAHLPELKIWVAYKLPQKVAKP